MAPKLLVMTMSLVKTGENQLNWEQFDTESESSRIRSGAILTPEESFRPEVSPETKIIKGQRKNIFTRTQHEIQIDLSGIVISIWPHLIILLLLPWLLA